MSVSVNTFMSTGSFFLCVFKQYITVEKFSDTFIHVILMLIHNQYVFSGV